MNDDPIDCELDHAVAEIFDKLLWPMMRNVIIKCGLPDTRERPDLIDQMTFLISKSGLTADERTDLAMQIMGLCQIVVHVPHDLQTRKGRGVRSRNRELLANAVDEYGRPTFQKLNTERRTSKYIADQIKADVDKFMTRNQGRSYKIDSIRKEVKRHMENWSTVQSPK